MSLYWLLALIVLCSTIGIIRDLIKVLKYAQYDLFLSGGINDLTIGNTPSGDIYPDNAFNIAWAGWNWWGSFTACRS
jgi:hypothetical protein